MPSVIFSGAAGRLDGMYMHSPLPNAPLAVLLHPSPMQGGTMNNKVVKAVYKTLSKHGFSVLRFNFRGVGSSEGESKNGSGELADAMYALDWIQKMNPGDRKIWVVGYSFGALIAMQLLMRRPEIGGFISICPPANIYDFSFLAPCPVSGLIVNGEDDVICPIEHVEKLSERLNAQNGISVQYSVIPECNHTFDSKLEDLQQIIIDYVTNSNCLEIAV